MYNCTKHDTGSAVARVTKDRAARPHLPSTVKNQLGRRRQRRQLLTIGQWNVRTLLDREGANRPERRTALVAMELAKYNIDIAALCETRFLESGSLNDLEYSFFWSGKPEGERREAGVGFAIKKDIITKLTEMPRPVSDRIMTMRLPLSKDNFATIISVYAPTMTNPDENKEAFYNQLASVLSGIPRTDKLLLIGYFNARIGRDNDKWPLVMGNHGIGKCNSNGELLLALCSEFELIVTNTMFKQKDERKTTWMHLVPDTGIWSTSSSRGVGIRWTSTVPEPFVQQTVGPITRCWGQKWLSEYDKSTADKEQVSRPSSTQQN